MKRSLYPVLLVCLATLPAFQNAFARVDSIMQYENGSFWAFDGESISRSTELKKWVSIFDNPETTTFAVNENHAVIITFTGSYCIDLKTGDSTPVPNLSEGRLFASGGRFYHTDLIGHLYTSLNGIDWQLAYKPSDPEIEVEIMVHAYGKGHWVFGATRSHSYGVDTMTLYSSDGINFAEDMWPNNIQPKPVFFADGEFVTRSGQGYSTCTDGSDWELHPTSTFKDEDKIIGYANGHFLIHTAKQYLLLNNLDAPRSEWIPLQTNPQIFKKPWSNFVFANPHTGTFSIAWNRGDNDWAIENLTPPQPDQWAYTTIKPETDPAKRHALANGKNATAVRQALIDFLAGKEGSGTFANALLNAQTLDALDDKTAPFYFAQLAYHKDAPFKDYGVARWGFEAGTNLIGEDYARMLSHAYLGQIYEYGWSVPTDLAKASAHYKAAAELGNAYSMYQYATSLCESWQGTADLDGALEWYKKAKKAGHKNQFLDSTIESLEKPDRKAFSAPTPASWPFFDIADWHHKAEAGNGMAMLELGIAHSNGAGTSAKESKSVAEYWRRKAQAAGVSHTLEEITSHTPDFSKALSEEGSPLAKALYALTLDNSDPEQMSQQITLCDDAISQGVFLAEYVKARVLENNADTIQEAIRFFKSSGEKGYTGSFARLSKILINPPFNLKPDYEEAFRYASLASSSKLGRLNLGLCYEYGYGVKQDYTSAGRSYSIAIAYGDNKNAPLNLAKLSANGHFLKKDDNSHLTKALKYAQQAKEAGNVAADQLIRDLKVGRYGRLPVKIESDFWVPGAVLTIQEDYNSDQEHFRSYALPPSVKSITKLFEFNDKAYAAIHIDTKPNDAYGLIVSENPNAADPAWTWIGPIPLSSNNVVATDGKRIVAASTQWPSSVDSTNGADWTERKTPETFKRIYGGPNGFFAITDTTVVYHSNDGINWDKGLSKDQLNEFVSPAAIAAISYTDGWLFAITENNSLNRQYPLPLLKDPLPLLISKDGKNWGTLIEDSKASADSISRVGFLGTEDRAFLSIDPTNTLFQLSDGATQRIIKPKMNYPHLFNLDGHLFGFERTREFSGLLYRDNFRYTGISLKNAKGSPIDAAPNFLPASRLYVGFPINGGIKEAIRSGYDLVANTYNNHKPKLIVLPDLYQKARSSSDLLASSGKTDIEFSDQPGIRFNTADEKMRDAFVAKMAKAEAGDVDAAAEVGELFHTSAIPVYANKKLSKKFLEIAASKGHPRANLLLARDVVHTDQKAAKEYYDIAIATHDEEAIFEYADLIGSYTWRNPDYSRAAEIIAPLAKLADEKATDWHTYFTLAATVKTGGAATLHKLMDFHKGNPNLPKFVMYSTQRCQTMLGDLGDIPALHVLLDQYTAKQNAAKIKETVDKLVSLNDPRGLFSYGIYLFNGQAGYAADQAKGASNIQAAADAGYIDAVKEVTRGYGQGFLGYTPNIATARKWVAKVRATGDAAWADEYTAYLDAEASRAANRGSIDGSAPNLPTPVYTLLKQVQDGQQWTSFPANGIPNLFAAIWWDAQFSPAEEDLIQEMLASSSISITDTNNNTFTFTKVPPAAEHGNWTKYLPIPFPSGMPQYPIQTWSFAVTPGPTVFFVNNPTTSEQARQQIDQAIFNETKTRVEKVRNGSDPQALNKWVNELLSRAKQGDPKTSRAFAQIIADFTKAHLTPYPDVSNFFQPIRDFAASPIPTETSNN